MAATVATIVSEQVMKPLDARTAVQHGGRGDIVALAVFTVHCSASLSKDHELVRRRPAMRITGFPLPRRSRCLRLPT